MAYRKRRTKRISRCNKAYFEDEIGARLTLAMIHRKDGSRREKLETRAYNCPNCGGYHLTSEPERTHAA
ncbi:hypothetical protein [Rhodococcus sp. ACS1]|uniref:hypothetical protein n=1 Tax=Rhodococcus sp. ACS1 TaxID=2028570 RepID=UPI001179A5AB|nr:hypothetical protein [Rhodococcus sp. ACS1]